MGYSVYQLQQCFRAACAFSPLCFVFTLFVTGICFFVCCRFFFFCFFFTTFGLLETSDEASSSDVVLAQKTSHRVRVLLAGILGDFARSRVALAMLTHVDVTVPTLRNFLRGSIFRDRCGCCFSFVDAANSLSESASIDKKDVVFTPFASLILQLKFIARCQSIFELLFFDDF